MPLPFIILSYCAAAVLCFFLIKPHKNDWEIGMSGTIGLSILWPLFLLMLIDWGFGYLFDLFADSVGKKLKLVFRK